ncbi:hypothetical protein [Agromyces soli]|uniref:Uncharacterized protein n=1 Tax=Agromyces soli TaxID=659012 RepID=A0ABY4AWX9_9MICO|nr:hypothetical protein [Agromyces soli]UOE27673.1 hypothetical protein MTP13_07820 [Agromyces soli]
MTAIRLGLPIPADAPHAALSASRLLGPELLVTSWVEGRATIRLGVLDLRDGSWRIGRGLRGLLRDALLLPSSRHALLLGATGLVEVELDSLLATRTLTAGLGRDHAWLAPVDDDTVAVGSAGRAMETLVSLSRFAVVGRRKRGGMPVPDARERRAGLARVLGRGDGFTVGASEERATAPQRMLLLGDGEQTARPIAELPQGLVDALLVGDGVLASASDLAAARSLTAVPGLRPAPTGLLPLEELAAAASASAEALLRPARGRPAPRTVHRDRRLEPGETIEGIVAERVTLEGWRVSRAERKQERPRLSGIRVRDLEIRASTLDGMVLEDVTVDGLRLDDSGFLFGCEFRRVTLAGRVRGLVLNPVLQDPDETATARYARWHRERLDDAEWMLDLSRATGDITIRGYPSRFIRRNPELHAVVTAAAVSDGAWREVDHGRSALRVSLLELARSGWEDVTLVADPHGRRAEDDLRYLDALRTAGIAEPD